MNQPPYQPGSYPALRPSTVKFAFHQSDQIPDQTIRELLEQARLGTQRHEPPTVDFASTSSTTPPPSF